MRTAEIRQSYLDFFEERGHRIMPSFPLIPHSDPTLLLVGAGMVPFKPYFLGTAKPEHRRVTTCQRCIRTPDIERVGITARHATFFEMLGNFSFGDYFKQEAIPWAWEFVTGTLGLPAGDLWITIYLDDDEAFEIWNRKVGVPAERIVRLGKPDNFWEIGVGPCGPCSEIHLDRGPGRGCGRPDCGVACECDRFLEIWNLVFIQFNQDEAGNYHPLASKGIDTGMGLERTAAVIQGKENIFEIDVTRPIIDLIARVAGIEYGAETGADTSLRVIADHLRGVTFMVSDGILPGNEGRGYILRRLLRRAVRHARLLGIEKPFLASTAAEVARRMREPYPDVEQRLEHVTRVISLEEEKFLETLDQGTRLLEGVLGRLRRAGRDTVAGADIFQLYDTYGFPLELTREMVAEAGLKLDEDGFKEQMEAQRHRARKARATTGYHDMELTSLLESLQGITCRFTGYESLSQRSLIKALISGGRRVEQAGEAAEVDIVLEETPFYAESGGQVGDCGVIRGPNGEAKVTGTTSPGEGLIFHRAVISGNLSQGDEVDAVVDGERRLAVARHHSATHLLHRALKEVMGSHANQAGSLVAPDRLRFDFTHYTAPSRDEMEQVERLVNKQILENLPVSVSITSYEEAVDSGAMALFGEKYGDEVRVVRMGDYSTELCGGTHIGSTGEIGLLKVIGETGIGAGIRRLEAVAGQEAYRLTVQREQLLRSLAESLKVTTTELPARIEGLITGMRGLEKENDRLRQRLIGVSIGEMVAGAQPIDGTDSKLVAAEVDAPDMDSLRAAGDQVRGRIRSGVIVLGSRCGESVSLVALVTDDLVAGGLHAGEIIRQAAKAVDGNGGGKPHLAQAGGKNPSGLPEALRMVGGIVRTALKQR